MKVYLPIRDLWMQGTDSIHKIRVMNTDSTSYRSKFPKKCLETAEKAKKNKYPDTCLKQCRQCTTFVVSVDGLLGIEAEAKLKYITSRLAKKWK